MEFSGLQLTLISGALAILGGIVGAAITAYLQPKISQRIEPKPKLFIELERRDFIFPQKIKNFIRSFDHFSKTPHSKELLKLIPDNIADIFSKSSRQLTYYSISISNIGNKLATNIILKCDIGSELIDPQGPKNVLIDIDASESPYLRNFTAHIPDLQPGHTIHLEVWSEDLYSSHNWDRREHIMPRMDEQNDIEFSWISHGYKQSGFYNPQREKIFITTTRLAYFKSAVRNFFDPS